ncbi:MAG: hypothetical protein ACYTX0_62265 [Nostoc sp.]
MAKPPSNRKKAIPAAKSDSKAPASSANENISQQVDPYLTVVEEKLLSLIEKEYGIYR